MDMEANNSNRRMFLKKVGYAAPAVIALGALSTSANASAVASSVIYSGTNGKQIVVTPGTGSATVSNNGNTVVIPASDSNLGDFADFLNN
jgi:hypothetical protein